MDHANDGIANGRQQFETYFAASCHSDVSIVVADGCHFTFSTQAVGYFRFHVARKVVDKVEAVVLCQ